MNKQKMKNLDELWSLWSSGNQKLVIELIKGQGLDIRLVLLDFWNNKLKCEKGEDGVGYKHMNLCQSEIGITSVPEDFTIIVYLDIKDHSYPNYSCFITNDCNKDDAWVKECGTIFRYDTFKEAEQAALEYFIKLIKLNE